MPPKGLSHFFLFLILFSNSAISFSATLLKVSDDIKEMMEILKPQDLDWSFIAENVDSWVEKAELEYVQ